MKMLTVYIGSTFKLVGGLQKDGAPADFSGSTLTAVLFDSAGKKQIAALDVEWLDVTKGLLTLTADSTAGWTPQKARIDVRLTLSTGDVVLGPPVYIRIEQSPLS
ncbi:hypothetical protein DN523_10210 [Burkholderia multivorans]|nr:hypothetical protein [Burkholderia multivorans]RAA25192.1 hypothetical protein DN471_17290 [Burkholderia multivorans]RAA27543.1 hypothetical protein DN470_10620 [Burkholderia multivorans]RAA36586.1 hypothetical protein DN465_07815 [Burkholderia multivorans]RAA42610.1 hypothetical protein DN472_17380 [Burkholderia multivorans]